MRDNERSSLWGMAAGGAVLGGAGYAFATHKRSFASAWQLGNRDVASEMLQNRASIPGFHVSSMAIDSAVADETLQALASTIERRSGMPGAIGNVRTAAYEAIMAGGKSTHEEAMKALGVLGEQTSGAGVYRAAVDIVGQTGGRGSLFASRLREFGSRDVGLAGVSLSEGGLGTVFAENTSFANLPASAQERALAIQENISAAAKGKFNVKWNYRIIDDVISGRKVSTPMLIGSVGKTRLGEIPLANTGYTYGGTDFTNRYVTRGAYNKGGGTLGFASLQEEIISDVISASSTNRELKQNMLNAHKNLIAEMNNRDAAHRAAAIYIAPFTTSGGAAKARLTNLEAVAYGDISPERTLELIGQEARLYPYTSPSAAGKGTLTTRNISEELFGPLGGLVSAEQRPTQFVRGEWGVTAEAKGRARGFGRTFGQHYSRLDRKIQGESYKSLLYGGAYSSAAEAYSAPQLMTFYAKPSTKGYGLGYQSSALNRMMSGEEGVISSGVTDMMEYERIVQKNITLDEGMRINEGLAGQLKGKKVGSGALTLEGVLPSGFMGIEKGTGREVIGDIVGAELTGANTASVFMRETKRLGENEMWKFFSEENKFMAAAANERRMASILEAAGTQGTIAGQQVEAVFSGKLVGRNKMALITQQTEAMSMFLGQKLDMGRLQMTPEIQSFLNDPAAALDVAGIMQRSGATADVQIQKNLMGMARGWGFKSPELALTFGLADEAAISGGILTARQRAAVRGSTGVIGLSKGMLGDIATEGGAGSWGSFEQTGFRALSMKGEAGQRYAVELSKRISGKGELAEADIMMSTLLGQEGIAKKFGRDVSSLEDFAKIAPENLVQSEGRFVNLGRSVGAFGGSNVMYIPGTNKSEKMVGDIIAKGERVRSPLASNIASFQSLIRRGKASNDEIELAASSLRGLALQTAEAQAAARGKIIGSQMLTGVRMDFADDADVFRVSSEAGETMFGDLISRSETDKQVKFLEQQRAAFREEKIMTGGMWRHPTSGPESFQFVKFKKDARIANGMVAAPTQFGKLQFQDKNIPVDVSAMVGFKGDFDRDQFVLSAISDERTNSMARRSMNNAQREAYSKYLFNHYTMKDTIEGKVSKSTAVNMLSDDALQQGFRKLSTAKTATGKVNIALQKLKIGVAANAPDEYRPLAEMFWHLEEAAIGGKHGVLSGDLYQAIAQSVSEGGESGIRRMEGVLGAIMGEEKRTITGTITDSFGITRKHSLAYNPRQWAETAIASYDAVSHDVDVSMRAVSAARGKNLGDISLNQAVEMYHARRTGSVDFAQALMQANAENMDSFTAKTSRLMRRGTARAKGMFGAISRAKKPLLAGLGVAGGVMLMAPGVSGSIGSTPEGTSAGRGMMPDDYGAPSGPGMNPPSPGMNNAPRVYDIGSGNKTSHANIRMRTNDLNSSSRDFMRSARQLSSGGQVNIKTKDDRSILDPRSLANKIHERL